MAWLYREIGGWGRGWGREHKMLEGLGGGGGLGGSAGKRTAAAQSDSKHRACPSWPMLSEVYEI